MKNNLIHFVASIAFLVGCVWAASAFIGLMAVMNNRTMRRMECKTFYYYEVLVPIAPIACLLRTPITGGKSESK